MLPNRQQILAVDDNPTNLEILKNLLSSEYRLFFAINGQTALKIAAEKKPDLILLDIMLPEMDGYEVCKRLKESEQTRQIPVIFVSAMSNPVDETKGLSLGAADYVRKPFNPAVLKKRIETQLNAIATQRAKDEFLASMSHELRTPLTAIIGSSELLTKTPLDEQQERLLQSIDTSSRNLLALINDILDLSKIEANKFEVEESEFQLEDLLDEIQRIFSLRATETNLDFVIAQHATPDHFMIGDQRRIGQILINLLSNAFKFSTQGRITLEILNADDEIHFMIIDEGIGMAPDVVQRIFQPFEQADHSISRRFGGTGLGLYISHQLAQLMGGRLQAESTEGVGSRFTLSLPYREGQLLSEQQTDTQQQAIQPLQGNILVAEDTPALQELEQQILESFGLEVTIAANGKEAVEKAITHAFDLVLMDMQMPEMDGLEATTMLRQVGFRRPIIALTANVMQQHRDQFEEAGCNGFLTKPIDQQALYQQLSEHLQPANQDTNERANSTLPRAIQLSDSLKAKFHQQSAQHRKELEQMLQEKNWPAIRATAHTIKGSGTTFGYPQLTELGDRICNQIDQQQMDGIAEPVTQLIQQLERIESP